VAVVLVDSSVITDPESTWYQWSAETLEKLDQDHSLIINLIIYAECPIGYEPIEEVESLFEQLSFAIKPIPREALVLGRKSIFAIQKT
jgi:hypothetical protein